MLLQRALLLLIAGFVSVGIFAQGLPSGWRYLVPTDPPIDAERVTLLMVKAQADFNGDGQTDVARVLMWRADPNRAGVFVFLAQADKPPQVVKLEEYKFSDGEFMLSTVRKGCYRSPERTVCLKNPGLLRSEIEYGWSTLYWLEDDKWVHVSFARGEFNGL